MYNQTWPAAHGAPVLQAVMRASAEDFLVEEQGKVTPTGQGAHLWLWIEKTATNTQWLAGQIATRAGCSVRDVGFAGLKDRHAVTRQWFSLPWPENRPPPQWEDIPGVRILHTVRHGRKLKRGTLYGNRFGLRLTAANYAKPALLARLQIIQAQGVPNYFGPQRFGRAGDNVEQAVAMLSGRKRVPRQQRSLLISALRSYLFNELLAERVRQGNWSQLLAGDCAMFSHGRSRFLVTADGLADPRLEAGEIHPSGPLFGRGAVEVADSALKLEHELLSQHQQLLDGLTQLGSQADRRPLRMIPQHFRWEIDGTIVSLYFELPSGGYATSVLRELMLV